MDRRINRVNPVSRPRDNCILPGLAKHVWVSSDSPSSKKVRQTFLIAKIVISPCDSLS